MLYREKTSYTSQEGSQKKGGDDVIDADFEEMK
jgi:molecular chaperone DnaK